MRRTPALIVGGGPAGAAAAIVLARAGAPHLLVERTRETGDTLCGGFLSWRTLAALDRLGVPADALNVEDITRVRLFAGDRSAEARLPAPAKAVSRRRLDTLLLAQAMQEGAAVERGVAVRAIDGRTVRIDGGEIGSDAVLLATGKHDLRGSARPAVAADDPFIGLRLHLPASRHLDALIGDAIELHMFAGGYAGLNRQEDGAANLCMAVRRSRLTAAGTPARLIAELAAESPALRDRIGFTNGAIDAVANVPYGWGATATEPGVWRLGDQAAVIPSLAGEGMGIAIASGVSAATVLLRDGKSGAEAWQAQFAKVTRRPVAVAGMVRAMAEGRRGAGAMVALGRVPLLVRLIANLTRIAHLPVIPGSSRQPRQEKS